MRAGWLIGAAIAIAIGQHAPVAAQLERATNGGAFEGWPADLAERARAIHRSFCIDLSRILPFQGGTDACERFQEVFLSSICTSDGRSLANPAAPNCLFEIEQDARAELEEVRWDLGIYRLPPRPMPPQASRSPQQSPQAHSAPATAIPARPIDPQARLDPMPRAHLSEDRSPRDIFAEVRGAIWVLIAVAPGRPDRVSQGSAVAVSPRHLLTTCHVIEGMTVLAVAQGNVTHPVSVSLSDMLSDRCVLQTDTPLLRPIRAVRALSTVEVGERVYSIAAPAGLELTLGEGLVSAHRLLDGVPTIQTTALVSPGSSGGALVDARGSLIGIIGSRLRSAPAIGFAIGADSFWNIAR
ncbi:S1C family serine protease [Falsiroseomonas oryziterrae]|uniref:S1C family serine protease n=1 Tax=Falsiroseomonas oryziterrae TaxID=2911368 RepID=UPI001F4833CA|nr:S1C family serine protease [Roseomonas sp. NPKOSM-4]